MKWSHAGIIWTISSAGWTVIAIVAHPHVGAALAALGCGAMAGACIWISND